MPQMYLPDLVKRYIDQVWRIFDVYQLHCATLKLSLACGEKLTCRPILVRFGFVGLILVGLLVV